MIIVGHAARVVLTLALLWSAGCVAAAVNWHTNWQGFADAGSGDGLLALEVQARVWHWAGLGVVGLLVAVSALCVAFWRTGLPDDDDVLALEDLLRSSPLD